MVLGVSVGCHPHYADEWDKNIRYNDKHMTYREFVTDKAHTARVMKKRGQDTKVGERERERER